MTAAQPFEKNPIVEETWATLNRIARWHEEFALQIKESKKASDRRHEELNRIVKKNARNIDNLRSRQEKTSRNIDNLRSGFDESKRLMDDLRSRQEETSRNIDSLRDSQKETSRNIDNLRSGFDESKRLMDDLRDSQKETNRQIGKLGGRFGEVIEFMVMPNLLDKFLELGLVFTKAYHDVRIKDRQNNIITQVDITLENGDKVMLVEVKSKPDSSDVKDHIERMEKIRRHGDLHGDKRKYLGGIAGMVVNDHIRDYILKQGFYVIEPSGETFTITPPEGQPKEW